MRYVSHNQEEVWRELQVTSILLGPRRMSTIELDKHKRRYQRTQTNAIGEWPLQNTSITPA